MVNTTALELEMIVCALRARAEVWASIATERERERGPGAAEIATHYRELAQGYQSLATRLAPAAPYVLTDAAAHLAALSAWARDINEGKPPD